MKNDGCLLITNPEMTRFNITMQNAVKVVLYALNNCVGGEIVVPKIPSFRLGDLANAIAPEVEHKIIGERPGEKIHEEMINSTDALTTFDLGEYYVILPPNKESKYLLYNEGDSYNKVPKDFHYNSLNNKDKLSIEDLQLLLRENNLT